MFAQQGIAPLIWFGINVQLHAGRSKWRGAPQQGLLSGDIISKNDVIARYNQRFAAGGTGAFARTQLIVPTETPPSP